MMTYEEMLAAAEKTGLEITDTLKAELRVLSDVSDEELGEAYRKTVVEKLARDFQVTPLLMEQRLGRLEE